MLDHVKSNVHYVTRLKKESPLCINDVVFVSSLLCLQHIQQHKHKDLLFTDFSRVNKKIT